MQLAMKVGIYLVDFFDPSIGGNFSYYDKLINAVDRHDFGQQIEICFVGRVPRKKIKLRKTYYQIAPQWLYDFYRILSDFKITQLLSRVFKTDMDLCARRDKRHLNNNGVDLIIFPKQFLKAVNNFPFISMNWDAGHKSTFAFPELLGDFDFRENWYQVDVQKSLAIFVESESSKEEFMKFYSIPESKIKVVPLFAGGVIDMQVSTEEQDRVLRKLNLDEQSFFYYPAQFWAHKNHYNLILAFRKLVSDPKNDKLRLVLSGSDKGNKKYIQSVIKANNLEKYVVLLDFIPNEEVYTMYRKCIALVMPSFLGPTNMPLLEARALRTAVICSDLSGHRETNKDGALYINPADSDSLYHAMVALTDPDVRRALIEKANAIHKNSIFNIETAIKEIESNLVQLIPVRMTFD
jgi:glycosyltransferase involved in cell wall biosynthesis